MNKNLIIYGTGKFAEYVEYVFEKDSAYTVNAFCMEKEVLNSSFCNWNNKPLVPFEKIDSEFPPENHSLFIAVGNNTIRKKIYEKAILKGYTLASYIASASQKWENLITGKNTFIDEGCVIQPFVEIGDNCILFSSNIAHHTTIGDHCLISVCTTGGNVSIGENCYIGMNSTIKQNVKITNDTVIGMGCVIENNILEPSVYTHKGTVKRNLDPEKISKLFLK